MVQKSMVEKSGVGKFMVEKSGVGKFMVEKSGVETLGWKVHGWDIMLCNVILYFQMTTFRHTSFIENTHTVFPHIVSF